ncbi:MAG: guanylate kinase [Rickettsiales bacterium]|nr:guanylate kinase [Rickettsiales bacterium]
MKLLNIMNIARQGLMLILSSPSGAGKTTLARKLLDSDPMISLSVSVTTRHKRIGEVEGKDYFFVSQSEYDDMLKNNMLLEGANVFGNYYGSPKKQAFDILNNGHDVLYDVNWEGAVSLMKNARQNTASIFILPPSMEVLEQRIRGRAQDSEAEIKKRLKEAEFEISKHHLYDYVMVNNVIDNSLAQIKSILLAERSRVSRCNVDL